MITPSITLLGRAIPLYGICFFAGILIASFLALGICKRKGLFGYDVAYSAVYVLIGVILGAKLLFVAVSFRQIIEEQIPLIVLLKGGFVFYGGFLGAVVGLFVYCKQFHVSMQALSEVYAAVLPLGHAFGRVGCFFAGCCYGIPYNGFFSCTYRMTLGSTPVGIPLLPIQLLEAVGLLLIFGVAITVYFRTDRNLGYTVPIYMATYPVLRFVLEFFRGDRERGLWGGLSTSQWISLLLFLGYFLYRIRKFKTSSKQA